MGKNQAYKAMQRARLGSASSVPFHYREWQVDGSFHSPEWHAARLSSLNTSHTITWEEFKRKQKEDELRKEKLEADKDKLMREYRSQLDAERAHKLALGRNHSIKKSKLKQERKEKDSKKRSSKRKRSRWGSSDYSSTSSSPDSSSSKDDNRETSRSRSKRSKRKKHKLKKADGSGVNDDEGSKGPVPLSRFFQSVKS